MTLIGPQLDALVQLLKQAFTYASLNQLIGTCLQADMGKEWVNEKASFNDVLRELLPKLAAGGLLAILLDRVAAERPVIEEALTSLRELIGLKTASTQEQTSAIQEGFTSVASKLQIPAVRNIVSQSQGVLAGLAAKITLLGAYKNLHDELHNARMGFRRLKTTCKTLDTKPSEFVEAVMFMEAVKEDIDKIYEDLPEDPPEIIAGETQWIDTFGIAVKLARTASKTRDMDTARQSIVDLRSVLTTEPSRIDTLLNETAQKLELDKLRDVFATAASTPELADEAAQLEEGRIAADQLLRDIQYQVTQHVKWQAIDRGLDSADSNMRGLSEDSSDFKGMWKGLKDRLAPLIANEPEVEWAKCVAAGITAVDAALAIRDWPVLIDAFESFRQDATTQFLTIDKKLKSLARGVNTLGKPLRNLLANS